MEETHCIFCTHIVVCMLTPSRNCKHFDDKRENKTSFKEVEKSVNKDKFIDHLNGILKEHFDYVPLNTTLKVAEELMNILPKATWIE